MTETKFENVEVTKRANVYYDGDVTSRELVTEDGVRKTLGIMQPGRYEFDTSEEELIELYAGELTVELDGSTETYGAGESFVVDAGTTFTVDVDELVEYCCTYR